MGNKARVEMVDYDQVKEMATIAFISTKGKPTSVHIHRSTFRALTGDLFWDIQAMGQPNMYQQELKTALEKDVRGSKIQWFDRTANGILEQRAKNARPSLA